MKKKGCVLIHGFTGSPREIEILAKHLQKKGLIISTPVLPGHGYPLQRSKMKQSHWQDWIRSAEEAVEQMAKQVDELYLIGFSMGGMIASYLATKYPVKKLVLLSASLYYINLGRLIKDFFEGFIHQPIKDHYQRYWYKIKNTPVSSTFHFRRLVRELKPYIKKIKVPTLIIQGLKDDLVDPKSAEEIYQTIQSKEKYLHFLSNSKHLICLDVEKEKVVQLVDDFFFSEEQAGMQMKNTYKKSNPFFHEGHRSVGILLIHGFTGSPAEMRLLGEYLHQQGYTVSAPLLAGHGTTPEEMAKTNKEEWFYSVLQAYDDLKEKGYQHIIAIGLSMGGILSLKLATERPLAAVISLAAPIYVHDKRIALARWIKYIKAYQAKSGKKAPHIEEYLDSYDRTPIACIASLHQLIQEVKEKLNEVTIPVLVLQGLKDETVQPKSAQFIFDHVASKKKEMKWYEKTSHIMTLDYEKEQIYADIRDFLERIMNKKSLG
ncbi:alpha/beta hydrolase [Tepidibacillus sp. LV47]|uniref:alpha/beta hydrolase n=1 Tax=Tepidibacillus sp. LV47 TaxID=3398228 RepID=UPI003AAF3E3A